MGPSSGRGADEVAGRPGHGEHRTGVSQCGTEDLTEGETPLQGDVGVVPAHGDDVGGEGGEPEPGLFRVVEEDGALGYVNLFYVVPELRRQGLGRLLHRHAVSVFSGLGKRAIRLSVAARNAEALAFYRKLGWRSVGSRPHREAMQVLELPL